MLGKTRPFNIPAGKTDFAGAPDEHLGGRGGSHPRIQGVRAVTYRVRTDRERVQSARQPSHAEDADYAANWAEIWQSQMEALWPKKKSPGADEEEA